MNGEKIEMRLQLEPGTLQIEAVRGTISLTPVSL
jgi:hypothetical protein